MNPETQRAVVAWKVAARELRFDLVAPFSFDVDGRRHDCLFWIANFGGRRGAVVCGAQPPGFELDSLCAADAAREGYSWSASNVNAYSTFSRGTFIETLADWGYTGPAEDRPAWLPGRSTA